MSEDNLYEEAPTVLFRPSYAHTWLNCEAALLDGRYYPDAAGEPAAQGTVFHDIMAEWQSTGTRPYYRLGQIAEIWRQDPKEGDKPFRIEIDEDMFHYGRKSLQYARKVKKKYHPKLQDAFVERRVDISHITPIPNQGGTLDRCFMSFRRADILDWKYGIGVKVFAPSNEQLLCYLAGVFEEYDWLYGFKMMGIHIVQPRLNHYDYWEISREDLIAWMAEAKKRAAGAWKRKNRNYTVGEKQCTWCRRRNDCPAKLAALEALADESFDSITAPLSTKEAKEIQVFTPPKSMGTTVVRLTTAQLAQIYAYRKLFESWFAKIGEVLLERGLTGEEIGDFYVTEGRKFAHWRSQEAIVEKLTLIGIEEDDIYLPRKLKSPNQMKPVLRQYQFKGKLLEDYLKVNTDKIPGKPTLVHKKDGRPAIENDADVFEEITE